MICLVRKATLQYSHLVKTKIDKDQSPLKPMDMEAQPKTSTSWLDRPLAAILPRLNVETLLVTLILILAVFSRFYILGERVMSHDEVNHVVPSYDLFQGRGYRHDPVTHGPMQFHLVALSYFMFGDSDFSSRIPSAVFSIATVAVVLFAFRRYLGRTGALISGALFLISPYMLFYGRYTRNESFVALFGVLTIYAMLRYLDRGDKFSLFLMTVVTALNFATKEVAFIYAAQLLLFIGILFLEAVTRLPWQDRSWRERFILLVVLGIFLLGLALGFAVWTANLTHVPEGGDAASVPAAASLWQHTGMLASVALAGLCGLGAVLVLVWKVGLEKIRHLRVFDLLILVGTLVLPQLTAFPVKLVGWDPLDYSSTGLLRTGIFLALFLIVSAVIGLWWRPRLWLANAAIFYSIFTVLYTTFFTNGQGFFTGIIGSLGYWLSQQGVNRGSQPWYYYAVVQIPMYEYLAALGTLLAVYYALRHKLFAHIPGFAPACQPEPAVLPAEVPAEMPAEAVEPVEAAAEAVPTPVETPATRLPVLAFLVFWSLTALVAYSVAGEKMPWLTVHIALPMLLAAGWGLGYLVDSTPWKKIANRSGLIAVLLVPVFLSSLTAVFGGLLGTTPPFQGNTLEQLQATSTFLLAFVAMVLSVGGILYLLRDWKPTQLLSLVTVVIFALLGVLTARTAYKANYVNYDTALEYLVYAHAARGPKDVLAQVEEISRRLTRGKDVVVAYDNDALYPYWWYLRDYPNHRWFTDKPTRDLRDVPLIIAGEANFAKLEPIVKDNFISYEYVRLWWPNQDYFNLDGKRIATYITDPAYRSALFQIWLNRDYTAYAKLTGSDTLTLENWQPANRMRLYIRKDVVAQIWNYGAAPVTSSLVQTDQYQGKMIDLQPDGALGTTGAEPGQFQAPRGVAVAADGTLYVADSRNHRIQHIDTEGKVLQVWGSFADAAAGPADGGKFNEPWGVAVAPNGSVYVTDTWNHRVQKFTADGQFVKMWGYFGQAEKGDAFWGPRGIAVDSKGRVFVSDTGNKRIAVFDGDGNFLFQFGTAGMDAGMFDEQVGLAFGTDDRLYVTDTWNQRVQVFAPDESGNNYLPVKQWDVFGWYGQSLDNKPFIAVNSQGHVFVTDPEGFRVLEFDNEGNFVRGWGDQPEGSPLLELPAALAFDPQGRLWVTDAGKNQLVRFTLPAQ